MQVYRLSDEIGPLVSLSPADATYIDRSVAWALLWKISAFVCSCQAVLEKCPMSITVRYFTKKDFNGVYM